MRGQIRRRPNRIELRAYAGINPATGQPQKLCEYLPPAATDKEIGRALTALVARADDLAATRRRRRKEGGQAPAVVTAANDRTAGDALEAWWTVKGQLLGDATTARLYLDSYLLPGLAVVEQWRLRGFVDDQTRRVDPDLFCLKTFFDGLIENGSVGCNGRPAGRPLSPATAAKAKGYLSRALNFEIERPGSTLTINPCAGFVIPKTPPRESTTPEPDELAAFLPWLAGQRTRPAHTVTRRGPDGTPVTYTVPERVDAEAADRVGRTLLAYVLLVASGPRPQEVSALRRGNLDRTSGRLELLAEGVGRDGQVNRGATEKRRKRTITLDRRTLAAVEAHLIAQDEIALEVGVRLGRRAFLFSRHPDATIPQTPDGPSQAFERTVAGAIRAGIPIPQGMRLYDMRHYGITQLLRAGRDIASVARRFGTSADVIRRTYEHVIPGDDDRLADTLEGIWGAPAGEATVVDLFSRGEVT